MANAALQGQVVSAMAGRLMELEKHSRALGDSIERQLHALTAATSALLRRPVAVYVGDHLALVRMLNGLLMYADSRDLSIAPHLLIEGLWEPGLTAFFLSAIRPGAIVVDIGANMGYFTLLAAQATGPQGRVYAMEPHPRSFEILQRNVAVNWLAERVRCIRCAVLDGPRQTKLHTTSTCLGSSSLFATGVPEGNFRFEDTVDVAAKTLDELVQEKVDVVKIDAEGSEPFILDGMRSVIARSPNIKIVMEFNRSALEAAGRAPNEFLEKIRELGFAIRQLTWEGQILDGAQMNLEIPISTLILMKT